MANIAVENNRNSTKRTKKYRKDKIEAGFKRVQKWVFDTENTAVRKKMQNDLANYHIAKDEWDWNKFAAEQLINIKGWQ